MTPHIPEDKMQRMIDDVAEDMTWLRAIGDIQERSKYNLTDFNEWLHDPFQAVSATVYTESDNLLGAMVILDTDEVCLAAPNDAGDALVIFRRDHMGNYGMPGFENHFDVYAEPFGSLATRINVNLH